MTQTARSLQVPYQLDPIRVNGYVLARCETLDVIAQGKTGEEASEQLADEIKLLFGWARKAGTVDQWIAKARIPSPESGTTLTVDL